MEGVAFDCFIVHVYIYICIDVTHIYTYGITSICSVYIYNLHITLIYIPSITSVSMSLLCLLLGCWISCSLSLCSALRCSHSLGRVACRKDASPFTVRRLPASRSFQKAGGP